MHCKNEEANTEVKQLLQSTHSPCGKMEILHLFFSGQALQIKPPLWKKFLGP